MSVTSTSSLSSTIVMSADELKSFIKSSMRNAEKEILEAVLVALKSKRKRRTPEEIAADASKPKRPTSEKQKHWNTFVSQVHAEMKEADPKAKRTDAMKKAKELRDEGKMPPAPVGEEDSDSESDAEPVAPPPKPVKAKEEKTKEKTKEKTEKKPAKPAPLPESDSEDDTPPKPAPKIKGGKSSLPKPKPAPKPAPPPPADSEDEDDGEALKVVTIGNKKVLMSSLGECWEQDVKGGMGKWLGLFDEKSKKIKPAPEPELE
jgi:hypothetical protein